MDSRYRDIVTYSHITRCISPNLKLTFILCVQYKENFLFRQLFFMIPRAQCLKYDKIIFRSLNLYNIHNPIVDINRKWKFLFAKLAINLFVFDHDMAFYSLHCFVSLEPLLETLEVDSSHGARAATGRDHWVEGLVVIVLDCIIVIEADSADHG